jgi:hypothetical protein
VAGESITGLRARPLDASTWPDFAQLVERNNGVWGGCWCMGFHPEGVGRTKTVAQNRAEKEARVRAGRAHAALVYDGAIAVGWCQFGPPDELPRIKRRRAYEDGLGALPDWRITCFFVDRRHRAAGSPPSRWQAPWQRSHGSAAARWRAIPRTPKDGRSPGRSCTTHGRDVREPGVRANPPPRQAPLGGHQGRAVNVLAA